MTTPAEHPVDHEPMWPALLALTGTATLLAFFPSDLIPCYRWLPALVVGGLALVELVLDKTGHCRKARYVGIAVSTVLTIGLIGAVGSLLRLLYLGDFQPGELLKASFGCWIAVVLTFAGWYWRLDGGGIHLRRARKEHLEWAFLFPQMGLGEEQKRAAGMRRWRPGFIDYVFIAFTASTAFSPTDTLPLTRWAKSLMMLQTALSLAVVLLLVARLINVWDGPPGHTVAHVATLPP